MGQAFILVGDKTDHGGVVLEGAPSARAQGKAIARVGDKVSCPKRGHNDATVIVSGDPDFLIDGKPAARHGDKTACGATLLASQTTVHDDDGAAVANANSVGLLTTSSPTALRSHTDSSVQIAINTLPKIEQKFFKQLEHGDLKKVNAIVLHRTGAPTAASTLSNYATTAIGAHFLIDVDGHIYQTIDIAKRAAHVGKLRSRCIAERNCMTEDKGRAIWNNANKSFSDKVAEVHEVEIRKDYPARYPSNDDSIGIEVVGDYQAETKVYAEPTTAQIDATKSLVTYLQKIFSLERADVYTHSEISYKAGHEGEGLGY